MTIVNKGGKQAIIRALEKLRTDLGYQRKGCNVSFKTMEE